jgi:hypothetical protein
MGQFKSLYQDKNLASSNDIYHAINSIGFPIVESNQMDNDNSDDEGAGWGMDTAVNSGEPASQPASTSSIVVVNQSKPQKLSASLMKSNELLLTWARSIKSYCDNQSMDWKSTLLQNVPDQFSSLKSFILLESTQWDLLEEYLISCVEAKQSQALFPQHLNTCFTKLCVWNSLADHTQTATTYGKELAKDASALARKHYEHAGLSQEMASLFVQLRNKKSDSITNLEEKELITLIATTAIEQFVPQAVAKDTQLSICGAKFDQEAQKDPAKWREATPGKIIVMVNQKAPNELC